MKTTKKLLALALTLAMVFALAAAAFAEGPGSITVDNPVNGATYTAYKIFDVVYDTTAEGAAGEHYSYTISGASEWFSVVATKNSDNTVTSKITGLTFEKAYSEDTYAVIQGNGFSAPNFAEALKAAVNDNKACTVLSVDDGKATATGLDLGYYFVTSSTGALCNLTTTNPDVTIHDKNNMPFDKVDDQASVDVGQIVNYTITGKVPDYTGFDTYTYLITDTMSEGLTFNKDVKVTVGGRDVTNECPVNNYDEENINKTKFTIPVPVMNYTIGDPIVVTYSAVVNEKAVAKIEKNHAVLEYSNDPTDVTRKSTTPPDEETVYSAKIVIDKYDSNKESTKLAGAKFVLYKEVTDEATKMYYKWNDTAKKVEWVTDKAQATSKTTDNNGAASFDGLADGTYHLEETAAPAGYNMLAAPVSVTVNGANATEADLSALTVTAEVANSTGTLLPSTGGMGTTLFYVLGSVLVLGAVVLLVSKKRMGKAE